LTNLQGFCGSTYDLKSVKISGSIEGVLREGVGKKKVRPHISPIWGSGKPNLLFPWGADRGYLVAKTYEATPHGGSPKNSRLSKKNFLGWVGGWVPEHGVLRGLSLSEWRTKFFEHLGQKPPDLFSFFRISTQGLSYAPQKMVKYLTFKKFTKNRGSEI